MLNVNDVHCLVIHKSDLINQSHNPLLLKFCVSVRYERNLSFWCGRGEILYSRGSNLSSFSEIVLIMHLPTPIQHLMESPCNVLLYR